MGNLWRDRVNGGLWRSNWAKLGRDDGALGQEVSEDSENSYVASAGRTFKEVAETVDEFCCRKCPVDRWMA